MRAYDLIWKKRQGETLSREELHFLLDDYVQGAIPDYQMSAWAMAVFFQGMTFEELTDLTLEMVASGETINLSSIPGFKVDKHSTGGVGDKTSLVILPLVAAAGVVVAKMSGRGLGHTGGTIDKLEAIPGFTTSLTQAAFLNQAQNIGLVLAGQTANLVPADKKLYALRDLTATVESIPLIAASIVSKKLASGADGVVLDVKYGDGALISDYDHALELARTMVEIGNRAGRKFRAVLSSMEQPLGWAVGNSLEVIEAIETLKGTGPEDLEALSLRLGGEMLVLAGIASTVAAGIEISRQTLTSGAALEKLAQFITAQGGNPDVIEDYSLLPTAAVMLPVKAKSTGWVSRIACRKIGLIAMELGAGRTNLEAQIRPEVGVKLFAKMGTFVKQGDVLAEIHAGTLGEAEVAAAKIQQFVEIGQTELTAPPLIGTEL